MQVYISRAEGAGRPGAMCVAYLSLNKKTMLMHVLGKWRCALLEDFHARWRAAMYEEVPKA